MLSKPTGAFVVILLLTVVNIFTTVVTSIPDTWQQRDSRVAALQQELDTILLDGSQQLNISISVAVLDHVSKNTVEIAHGVDDRQTGEP